MRSPSPLKSRLRGLVLVRVVGPCLLAREAEPLDDQAHAAGAVAHTKAILGERAEIVERVGGDAVDFGIGSGDDRCGEALLLRSIEPASAPRAGTILEPSEAFDVVALDGVAERLALHAGGHRRLREAHAVECVGDGQEALDRARRRIPPCHRSQLVRREEIAPDLGLSALHDGALRIKSRLTPYESRTGREGNPPSHKIMRTVSENGITVRRAPQRPFSTASALSGLPRIAARRSAF